MKSCPIRTRRLPTTGMVMPALTVDGRRRWRPGIRRLWRCLQRHLRRHLRRRRTRSLERLSRCRPALQPRSVAGGSGARRREDDPHSHPGQLRDLPRQRRKARHPAKALHHLRRRRPGPHAAGLLLDPADLPEMSRFGPHHPRALPQLRRRRTCQAAEDLEVKIPAGIDDGMRFATGPRRAGHQWRAGR